MLLKKVCLRCVVQLNEKKLKTVKLQTENYYHINLIVIMMNLHFSVHISV